MRDPKDNRQVDPGPFQRLVGAVFGTGESRSDWMAAVAEEVGGSFTELPADQSNISGRIHFTHNGCPVTVALGIGPGKSPQEFLIFKSAFETKREFEFRLADQNFLHDIAERFGFLDVQVGIPEIDEKIRIHTKQHELIKQLLQEPKIVAMIKDPRYGQVLMESDEKRKGFAKLQFDLTGEVSGPVDLRTNIDRFRALLDKLKELEVI